MKGECDNPTLILEVRSLLTTSRTLLLMNTSLSNQRSAGKDLYSLSGRKIGGAQTSLPLQNGVYIKKGP